MPDQEEIVAQQELLQIYRRTLRICQAQHDKLGFAYAPPAIIHCIVEACEGIRRAKQNLHAWGIIIQDLPTDDADVHILNDKTSNLIRIDKSQSASDLDIYLSDAVTLAKEYLLPQTLVMSDN